jgi:hypothetical protein
MAAGMEEEEDVRVADSGAGGGGASLAWRNRAAQAFK